MATENEELCGDELAILLEEGSSAETAGRIAKEIGFNDSPIFGAKKKKARIETEVAILNAAVIICAVNQVVDETNAKPIIDEFLKKSKLYVIEKLERKNPRFPIKYTERLSEYFAILSRDKPVLGWSNSFFRHVGVAPLNLEGQLAFARHIAAMLKKAMAIVNTVRERSRRDTEVTPMTKTPYHTKEHPAQHWMLIDIASGLGPTIHPAMAPIVERLKGLPHFGTASDEDVEEFDRVLKIAEEDWAGLCADCGRKIGDPAPSGKDDGICADCVEEDDPEHDKMIAETMEAVEKASKPYVPPPTRIKTRSEIVSEFWFIVRYYAMMAVGTTIAIALVAFLVYKNNIDLVMRIYGWFN